MILVFFKLFFWVQAVHLEEKVRKSALLILKINGGLLSIKFSYMCNFIALYVQERAFLLKISLFLFSCHLEYKLENVT